MIIFLRQILIQHIAAALLFSICFRKFRLRQLLPQNIHCFTSHNGCQKIPGSVTVNFLYFVKMPGQRQKSLLHRVLCEMGILQLLICHIPQKMPVLVINLCKFLLFLRIFQKCQKEKHIVSSGKCIYINRNVIIFYFTTLLPENLLNFS